MLRKLISLIFRRLGKEDYVPDNRLSNRDLISILRRKGFDLLRGFWVRLFLKRSAGLVFVGAHCTLMYKSKISSGRTLTIGNYVHINALSSEGVIFGDNVTILDSTIIECTGVIRNLGEGLVIGRNVGIAQKCFIQVRGRVVIGNEVIFGPEVSVFSENHNFDNPGLPVLVQGETRKGVIIEDGVWVGTHAIILDGVRIGKNSVVAAGCLVNKDVPPYSVVAGIPAKIIRTRKDIQ